jgi:hypothetical protein
MMSEQAVEKRSVRSKTPDFSGTKTPFHPEKLFVASFDSSAIFVEAWSVRFSTAC